MVLAATAGARRRGSGPLADSERLPAVYRSVSMAMAGAAAAALVVGWLRPEPWILALVLGLIFLLLWFVAVVLFIRARAWPPA